MYKITQTHFMYTPRNNYQHYIHCSAVVCLYITLLHSTFQSGFPQGLDQTISAQRPCFFSTVIMGNITAQYFLTEERH